MSWRGGSGGGSSGTGIPSAGATGQVVGYKSAGIGQWVYPPGYELNYTETSTPVTVTHATAVGSAITVLSPGAITFDGSPVIAEFYCPQAIVPASLGNIQVGLFESSTNLGIMGLAANPSGNQVLNCKYRFTPTAGAHTYVLKAWNTGATNDSTLNCGAGGSNTTDTMFIRFTKV